MRIDSNKLEVKYTLEIYNEVPGFPSHTDRLYVMMRALEDGDEDGTWLDREFVAENIWIPMRSCIGTLKEFREFLDSISDDPQHKVKDVILHKTRTERTRGYYKLITNPWM